MGVIVQHLAPARENHGEGFMTAARQNQALHAAVKLHLADSRTQASHEIRVHVGGEGHCLADMLHLLGALHAAQVNHHLDERPGGTGLDFVWRKTKKSGQAQNAVALIRRKVVYGPALVHGVPAKFRQIGQAPMPSHPAGGGHFAEGWRRPAPDGVHDVRLHPEKPLFAGLAIDPEEQPRPVNPDEIGERTVLAKRILVGGVVHAYHVIARQEHAPGRNPADQGLAARGIAQHFKHADPPREFLQGRPQDGRGLFPWLDTGVCRPCGSCSRCR